MYINNDYCTRCYHSMLATKNIQKDIRIKFMLLMRLKGIDFANLKTIVTYNTGTLYDDDHIN